MISRITLGPVASWCVNELSHRRAGLPRRWMCSLGLKQSHQGFVSSATASVTGRVRESGMPALDYWESLVNADDTLDRLGFLKGTHSQAVEFGCGYGTFSLPIARRVAKLRTFDIDTGMLEITRSRSSAAGLMNIQASERDVLAQGYGVASESVDAALLCNILHADDPVWMMREAALMLVPSSGRLYATHWRHDPATPRGPPLEIRPRPEQLEKWALETGLLRTVSGPIDCPPWHYGWVFARI
eukprot:CAMPEP_0169116030 /NCGR_PEP_ID=MMETSP1015-20121227/29660_1 /TAXON_ID=342587 /ORGANISM="Karlodinium micrum, Strain CCMP2283" /LENGTH=242 /DNA_ID=CAMNT_0009178525 /DNA_START=24 /DNA_END=752 /DNA_ORIENTATION=+